MANAQALSRAFGERLRGLREARGQSATELAGRAELSRRYLFEAEAGRANPSLEVLARLARALGVPLAELLSLERAARSERVALLGLRGAGKSSVGPLVARALDAPFIELDQRVEELAGMSLAEIFGTQGEAGFRRLEAEALERVLAEGARAVLATSGSIVDAPATFARLRETCHTVWLAAEPDEHYRRVLAQGDRRPMQHRPRARQELREILDRRRHLYGQCGLRIETDGRSPEEIAGAVIRGLEKG